MSEPNYIEGTAIRETGWYWFLADQRSPQKMRRNAAVVVLVGTLEDDDGGCEFVVRFPQGVYATHEMGGRFFGPLPDPFKFHKKCE